MNKDVESEIRKILKTYFPAGYSNDSPTLRFLDLINRERESAVREWLDRIYARNR